jgi:cardiolipin synthase
VFFQFFLKKNLRRILVITFFLFIFPLLAKADQLIIEPDMGRDPIINAIKSAQYSIHLVMYGMTDSILRNELIKKKNQGIAVKIILERAPYKNSNENRKTIFLLNKNQMDWISDLPNIRLIHEKTLLIDDKKALIMNFNFTRSAFKNDRNFGLIIDDVKTVNEIEHIFSSDWNKQAISLKPSSRILLSPENSRKQILALLSNSKTTIDIYAQDMNDPDIVHELKKAAKRNVSIRVITSHALSSRQARYLKTPSVLIHNQTSLYIHAKAIIIDKKYLIIGSTNLTHSSLNNNRELSIVSSDATVLKQIQNIFNSDWLNSN